MRSSERKHALAATKLVPPRQRGHDCNSAAARWSSEHERRRRFSSCRPARAPPPRAGAPRSVSREHPPGVAGEEPQPAQWPRKASSGVASLVPQVWPRPPSASAECM